MLSSITNRFAALEVGFLSRLYLLIAALALLLVLLGGSSLAYLNRLSDLLFVAARLIGLRTQVKEVLWQAAPKPKA